MEGAQQSALVNVSRGILCKWKEQSKDPKAPRISASVGGTLILPSLFLIPMNSINHVRATRESIAMALDNCMFEFVFAHPIDIDTLCESMGGKDKLVVYDILRKIETPAALNIRITEMTYPCFTTITGSDIANIIHNFPFALSSIADAMKMEQTGAMSQ